LLAAWSGTWNLKASIERRRCRATWCANADLILAMGTAYLERIEALGGGAGRAYLLSDFASRGASSRAISDPIGMELDVYRATADEAPRRRSDASSIALPGARHGSGVDAPALDGWCCSDPVGHRCRRLPERRASGGGNPIRYEAVDVDGADSNAPSTHCAMRYLGQRHRALQERMHDTCDA